MLDDTFDPAKLDYEKMGATIPLQDISKVAHFLLFIQAAQKHTFKHLFIPETYLQHIPGRPEELSDENYLVIQKWIPELKEFKKMSEKERFGALESMPSEAREEAHIAIVNAGLWNHMNANLSAATDGPDKQKRYCFVNIQGPFNHHPDYFCFQGEQGQKKHTDDTSKALDRMIYNKSKDQHNTKEFPEGGLKGPFLEHWRQITREDKELMSLFKKYRCIPKILK